MKKIIVYVLLIVASIGLLACTKAEIEKNPVIIENEDNDFIAGEDALNTISGDSEGTEETEETNKENPSNDNEFEEEAKDETKKMIIHLEGMAEEINVKSHESDLGYKIDYDIDRFTLTSEDGTDNFIVENVNPELIPYVYVSISRIKNKDFDEYLEQLETSLRGENDDVKVTYGEALTDQLHSEHIYVVTGLDWNSAIRHYYLLDLNGDILLIETQYSVVAEEGYGARIWYMLRTLELL